MYRNIFKSRVLSVAIVALGIAMMYIGAQRGEALFVLNKAIKVCMECLGSGSVNGSQKRKVIK